MIPRKDTKYKIKTQKILRLISFASLREKNHRIVKNL